MFFQAGEPPDWGPALGKTALLAGSLGSGFLTCTTIEAFSPVELARPWVDFGVCVALLVVVTLVVSFRWWRRDRRRVNAIRELLATGPIVLALPLVLMMIDRHREFPLNPLNEGVWWQRIEHEIRHRVAEEKVTTALASGRAATIEVAEADRAVRQALRHERLGELDAAEKQWRIAAVAGNAKGVIGLAAALRARGEVHESLAWTHRMQVTGLDDIHFLVDRNRGIDPELAGFVRLLADIVTDIDKGQKRP
ncbi:hypothetical protein ACFWPX_16270 [Nocardia sp. NPDC058518]|uniref:hypothetical protein n=1 Tax=Nocardia sp. NPDC058518 TaxID=3346534 RepID=UPI003661E650